MLRNGLLLNVGSQGGARASRVPRGPGGGVLEGPGLICWPWRPMSERWLSRSLSISCNTWTIFFWLGNWHNHVVCSFHFWHYYSVGTITNPTGAYWGGHDELSRLDVFMESIDLPMNCMRIAKAAVQTSLGTWNSISAEMHQPGAWPSCLSSVLPAADHQGWEKTCLPLLKHLTTFPMKACHCKAQLCTR